MLSQKIFEILHTAVAIIALFEQVLGKFCLNCLPPKSESFSKYDAFCSYIFDYACLGRIRFIVIEKVQNYRKTAFIKNLLKMAGGEMHPPH